MELEFDIFTKLSIKIIDYFIQSYSGFCSNSQQGKNKIIQIQILLQKFESCCRLQLAYCGNINLNIENLCSQTFQDITQRLYCNKISLATICSKNDKSDKKNDIFKEVICLQDKIILIDQKPSKYNIWTYWDAYTCISLKHKIKFAEIELIVDLFKSYITNKKKLYPKIRFVFMKDGQQIIDDSLDFYITNCHSIANSMGTIVANSRNEEFRKKCLEPWKVNSSQEYKKVLFNKLLEQLENDQ